MKRLVEFIRSVIPTDPFQLFLLGGSVLLFICMQLRCIPALPDLKPGMNIPHEIFDDSLTKVRQSWQMFSFLARLPVFFAGAAGLFVCFWPGRRPVRRTLIFVCLPAIGGLSALCVRFLQVGQDLAFPVVSVFQRSQHNEAKAIQTLWSMGPALHMAFLGAALVLVFASRLAMGIASLPLSLAMVDEAGLQKQDSWKRIKVCVWLAIASVWIFMLMAWSLMEGVFRLLPTLLIQRLSSAGVPLATALATAMLAGIAAWAVGESRWRELRQFTRLPDVSFGMLGAVIPIAINLVSNLLVYLRDRIHWAAFDFGKFGPPLFSAYFKFPDPYYFWYLPAAAFEEIIWRGYLQPRFVRRFGIIRGILLLSLIWGASHFSADFQRTSEDYQVFQKLAFRLFSCVVLGYVFGWLTLRSGSIWPVALAHGFHNVWVISSAYWLREQDSWLLKTIPWVCWVILAILLFRFWPPTVAEDIPADSEPTSTEPPPITETAS